MHPVSEEFFVERLYAVTNARVRRQFTHAIAGFEALGHPYELLHERQKWGTELFGARSLTDGHLFRVAWV